MLASFAVDNNIISQSTWYARTNHIFAIFIINLSVYFYYYFIYSLPMRRWMGEKYDGVRCCWNPDMHCAYPTFDFIFFLSL